jgi:CubicO group peptidase (beta-lactamase class C family)
VSTQLRPELSFEARPGTELAAAAAVNELREYLSALLSDGFPPSVSLAVVDRDGVALEAFGGYACIIGELVPTTIDTSYDLASLTKVVCTVTLALIARERGWLTLDDPVARWLPQYPMAPGASEETTLRHLLTHTAGLVDHRPFYATLRGRGPIEAAIYEEARSAVAGSPVRYSDLGYMLLGWALEACFQTSLDEAFASMVAGPLGMAQTQFRPEPEGNLRAVAATELDGDQRTGRGLIWGEVHDGNAFALGGVSGHAGLFAPLGDLARFVQRALVPDGVLSAEAVALMSTRQAGDGNDIRGIGWRLDPVEWGKWPERTLWHTGFTGTSLLIAPETGVAVVLLTNSVHPRRRLEEQGAVRVHVHKLLAEVVQRRRRGQ